MAWVKRLFVDEVDATFKKKETETLQLLTRYVLATFLQEKVNAIVFENCVGCKINHPSQDQHICIAPDPNTDCLIEFWYHEAADTLDIAAVKEVIAVTQENIEVGVLPISPEFDLNQYIIRHISTLKETEFSHVIDDLEIDDGIKQAVSFAKEEIDLCKELMEKWKPHKF